MVVRPRGRRPHKCSLPPGGGCRVMLMRISVRGSLRASSERSSAVVPLPPSLPASTLVPAAKGLRCCAPAGGGDTPPLVGQVATTRFGCRAFFGRFNDNIQSCHTGLAQTPASGSLRSRRELHFTMPEDADIERHGCASHVLRTHRQKFAGGPGIPRTLGILARPAASRRH